MTYISLDPKRLQHLITNLTRYATISYKQRGYVKHANELQGYPTDLTQFQNRISSTVGILEEKTKELQARLDSAKAANESGITPMGANGMISYFIPDGEDDTIKNALKHNHVETVKQAREDARKLKEYSTNQVGPSGREWDSLVKRMKANQNDSVYANAIIANIDPKDLRNIPIPPPEAYVNYQSGGLVNAAILYKGLSYEQRGESAEILGHLVSTASNTWPESKAKKYAEQLTENIDRRGVLGLNRIFCSSRSVDIDGDGKKERIGLDYNDSMLAAVGTKLERWPGKFELYGPYSVKPETGMLGIAHAMTGNTGAAAKWLAVRSSGNGGKGAEGEVDAEKTAARTKKLVERGPIGDSQWTDDWTLLAAQQAASSSDAPSHGAAEAGIVSGALNAIGEGDNKLKLSDKARNAASIAMSAYPYGVQRSAETDDLPSMVSGNMGKYGWSKNLPRQPLLTNKALTNVLGQIGQNNTALTRLTGSQEAFNKMQISPENVPQGNTQYLSNTLTSQSRTRGFMQGAIARQAEIDGADADARTAAWANVASMAIGSLPIPGLNQIGKALELGSKFAANVGKSAASEGAKNGMTKLYGGQELKAKDKNSALKAAGVNSNRQISGMALLKSGLYSQDELKAVTKIPGVDVGEVLTPDGELKVHTGGPFKGTQAEALIQVVKNLPAENHGALNNVDKNMSDSYESAYDAAHEQPH